MRSTLIAALLLMPIAPAEAQASADAMAGLDGCRRISDRSEKLTCFEREADLLIGRSQRREVIVASPREIKQAVEIPDEIVSTIAAATPLSGGLWRVELAHGGIWRTTEVTSNARLPAPGLPVVVKKGLVAGYMLSVDRQRSIRAAPVR
jgi:hypothetical protein